MSGRKKIPWVVIIGAGFGGMSAAMALDEHLRSSPKDFQVALVDSNDSLVADTANQFALMGKIERQQVTYSYGLGKFEQVFFVQDTAVKVDHENKTVYARGHKFVYELLVLATGSVNDGTRVPNLVSASYDLASLTSVMQLRDGLQDFNGGTILICLCEDNAKDSASAYEYAFLIQEMMQARTEEMRKQPKVMLTTSESAPLPAVNPEVVENLLNERGIDFKPDVRPVYVDAVEKTVIFSDGDKVEYGLLLSRIPQKAADVLASSGLTEKDGFVNADAYTCKTKWPGIYAIGGCASMPLPFDEVPAVPRASAFTVSEGETVARDIIARIASDAQDWNMEEGESQNKASVVVAGTGNRQAITMTADFFTDPDECAYEVSVPDSENMKLLIEWWNDLIMRWFSVPS